MEPYAPLSTEVQKALKDKGYNLHNQDWDLGNIQAIRSLNGQVEADPDPAGS